MDTAKDDHKWTLGDSFGLGCRVYRELQWHVEANLWCQSRVDLSKSTEVSTCVGWCAQGIPDVQAADKSQKRSEEQREERAEVQDFPRVKSQRSAARRKKTSPRVCSRRSSTSPLLFRKSMCVAHWLAHASILPCTAQSCLFSRSMKVLLRKFRQCWCGISCQLLEFTEVCNGDYRSSGNHNLDCTFSCGPQPTERACAFQKTVSERMMDMHSLNA